MRFQVLQGDCREVMPIFLGRLQQCVCLAMAWMAKRYEVGEIIGSHIIPVEQSVWSDVVYVYSRPEAVLAGGLITPSSLALLGLPVRAAIGRWPTKILRMKYSDTLNIAASPRTELSLSRVARRMARRASIVATAADTTQRNLLSKLLCYRFVLAFTRARFATSVLKTRLGNGEGRSACLTISDHFHSAIIDHEKEVVYV